MVIVLSLDIQGAFNATWWPAILNQLKEKNVETAVQRLLHSYMDKREIRLRYAGVDIRKRTERGCIQGSTCGPTLWNIQLDPLLRTAEKIGIHMQAFADDILIITKGHTKEEIEPKTNLVLSEVMKWAEASKMEIAANKTQATLFTNKLKYEKPKLYLGDTEINYSDNIKVLGLHIDRKLNFSKHLDNAYLKACKLYKMVSRAARAQWGLNSKIIRMIYLAVVEPTVLYAAGAWGEIAERIYAQKKLDRITRTFSIRIAKAHRTISLTSGVTLARIIPLDLRVIEHKLLYNIKKTGTMDELPDRPLQMRINPSYLPHPADRRKITFQLIEKEEDLDDIDNDHPRIFTDGSKVDDKVGGALTIRSGNEEIGKSLFRLEDYNSVYQAEMFAILKALQITEQSPRFNSANIFCDARSALESISDPNSLHPLAQEIRNTVARIEQTGGNLAFYWVRSHSGITGNERADELAKHAARNNRQRAPYDAFPLSFAKRLTREKTVQRWQSRYSAAETGSITKLYFPNVKRAYKILANLRMTNLRAQLLTGHGGFRAYLFRFKLTTSPYCICDDVTEESIIHIITECPRFAVLRFDCESQIDNTISADSLANIIDDDRNRIAFLEFAEAAALIAAQANGSTVT